MPRARLPLLLCLLLSLVQAAAAGEARIALIIDDLGNDRAAGLRAVALPGPVTLAILPRTPHGARLARAAHERGKGVMLHLPLEALGGAPLGPGGIGLHMDRYQFLRTLREDLVSVPHARGVNNHMGSLLTRHPGAMAWLMRALRAYGLYFVDSRTTPATVATQLAAEIGVPYRQRDVFLDHDPEPAAVAAEFERLIARARQQGSAVGIGHPHPVTLAYLERALPQLRARGVELVPVTEILEPSTRPGPPELPWVAAGRPAD